MIIKYKKINFSYNMTYYLSYFFYTGCGDFMKVYIDLVLLLNFGFDFLLVMAVALLLRRQSNLWRLCLAAFVGSITILSMFIEIGSFWLFVVKMGISILMVLIAFGYQDLRYTFRNLFYLYTSSIMLGGSLYLLSLQFSCRNEGLVFYFNGLSINLLVFIILSPIIIYAYVKQGLHLKNHYSHYYHVDIYLKGGEVIELNGFLDTGNKLVDPYKRRPIILVNSDILEVGYDDNLVLVPYDAVNYHGLLKCVIPEKIFIQGVGYRYNFLIGITNRQIKMDGVDCILHEKLIERVI